jgi:hypothetical protein
MTEFEKAKAKLEKNPTSTVLKHNLKRIVDALCILNEKKADKTAALPFTWHGLLLPEQD